MYSSSQLPSLSAAKLVKLIKARKISVIELLELFIQRYEQYNPRINAIVTTDFEGARKLAHQADIALAKGEDWGPLHGLPMTVKDCFEFIGMPTTWGSQEFKNHISIQNSPVVQSLVDAGAIIFGKTNLPIFSQGTQTFNDVFGQTNNPWDISRAPGGSSGGSAAALAAGLTGLEIGADIGGSIRCPAHFCGVYGHKPSFGIVPVAAGPMAPTYLMDYQVEMDLIVRGPLSRSAEDLALVMDLIVKPPLPFKNAIKIKLSPSRKSQLTSFRVGLWLDDAYAPMDTDVGNCLQNLIDNLARAGVQMVEEKPEVDLQHCHELGEDLMNMALSLGVTQENVDWANDEIRNCTKNDQSLSVRQARAILDPHRKWLELNTERTIIRQKWADFFKKYDVLLCPIVGIAAFHHDHSDINTRMTLFNEELVSHRDVIAPWSLAINLPYIPATVAPIGFTPKGLPVGVQIVGPFLEDYTPIQFAQLLEEEVTGPFRLPDDYE
jgi:amidase